MFRPKIWNGFRYFGYGRSFHSFKRGLENEPNIQDAFLRDVATGIRLACERDFLRLDVLTRLRTPIRDFNGLNGHIADQCTKLLKERRQEGFSATQIALIRAIGAVAKLEQSRDDRYFPSSEKTKLLSDSDGLGRPEKSRSADRGALIPADARTLTRLSRGFSVLMMKKRVSFMRRLSMHPTP